MVDQKVLDKVSTGVKVFGGLFAFACFVALIFSLTPAGAGCFGPKDVTPPASSAK